MNYFDYITILTPDNIEVKYRLAGLGSRMAAAVFDLFIQIVVIAVAVFIYVTYEIKRLEDAFLYPFEDVVTASFIIFMFVFIFGYYIVSELFFKGQTIGKRLFKLRVIRENGRPAGFVPIFIRTILKFFVDYLGVGVILILFSKKQKRLGDLAASTIVVSENPKRIKTEAISLSAIVAERANTVSAVSSKLVITKEETELLRDFFLRKDTLTDNREALLHRLRNYFAYRFGVDVSYINEKTLYELYKLNNASYFG